MKLISFIFLFIISANIYGQIEPSTISALTEEDREKDEWCNKISEVDSLENYYLKLVTTKGKEYSFADFTSVQVFDKYTNRFVQEIELECDFCNWHGAGTIGGGDFNFDGYEDFSLFAGYAAGPNTVSLYLLYDPEIKKFFVSEIMGTSLEFNDANKTIFERNQCCAGMYVDETTYKVVDNKMVIIKKQCLELDPETMEYFDKGCGDNEDAE